MLKRKMYDRLLKWKNDKREECLLIKGARQVGKTYLVRQFGANEYESYIEINFHMQSNLKVIFEGELSSEEIYKRITANIPGVKFIPGKTLLFLDEIQKCSNARTALKFLAQDKRFDVIASGSLLGLAYGQDADKEVTEVDSIPVTVQVQYFSSSFWILCPDGISAVSDIRYSEQSPQRELTDHPRLRHSPRNRRSGHASVRYHMQADNMEASD